jgi:hypothetical protein
LLQQYSGGGEGNLGVTACGMAYSAHLDPITTNYYGQPASGPIPAGYPGYDPLSVDPNAPADVNNGLGLPPNNGEGFTKDLSGNELPNAPHFTLSLGADYTIPVTPDWAATLHTDFYWQDKSWARVFNDDPYDRIRGYTNLNLALILTDQSGWQVMGYVKNVFDTTAITGDFLNSDDSGLTTNIFLTDPRLFGVRVTKHFDGGSSGDGGLDFLSGDHRPQVWVQLGGSFNMLSDGSHPYDPTGMKFFPNGGSATPAWPSVLPTPAQLQKVPQTSFNWEGALFFQPDQSDWTFEAGIRYGRSSRNKHYHKSAPITDTKNGFSFYGNYFTCDQFGGYGSIAEVCKHGRSQLFDDSQNDSGEQHTMLDFTLGKDFGLGSMSGKLSAGVRIAQFHSQASLTMGADPHYNFVVNVSQKYHEIWEFSSQETRTFHGVGPEAKWDGSTPILGDAEDGQLTFDWGINAAVLFGRQSAILHHAVKHCRVDGFGSLAVCEGGTISGVEDPRIPEPPDDVNRSRNVTVPNLGGYVGASMRYHNSKVSLGYRADTFFNAMDGGQETHESTNRGFYGPYLNVSLGL